MSDDVPRIGMGSTDLVRLIRKRVKEDLGDGLAAGFLKVGTKIERGTAMTGEPEDTDRIRGTWIDVTIFVPDEECARCNEPIDPGKEIEVEGDDWGSPCCPSCAKRYHVTPKGK